MLERERLRKPERVSEVLRYVVIFLFALSIYLIFVGSVKPYDLATGIATSIIVSALCGRILVKDPQKLRIGRLLYLLAYTIKYIGSEIRAHAEVAKRILSRNCIAAINPGIVRVPYTSQSDYSVTMVANSITNTPGTVVIDIDPEERCYYVHWLYVKTYRDEEIRRQILSFFEDYAKKVFD